MRPSFTAAWNGLLRILRTVIFNGARSPSLGKKMVPVTKEIVGCDCFQGDVLTGSQETQEILNETLVLFECRLRYRPLFAF